MWERFYSCEHAGSATKNLIFDNWCQIHSNFPKITRIVVGLQTSNDGQTNNYHTCWFDVFGQWIELQMILLEKRSINKITGELLNRYKSLFCLYIKIRINVKLKIILLNCWKISWSNPFLIISREDQLIITLSTSKIWKKLSMLKQKDMFYEI